MGRVPRLLIGAARSGSGKTLITCALLKALQKRKKQAVSFKCGPDYIDPLFHREALGIDSDNLDSFLCTPDQVRALLAERAGNCEIAVLEGVMGYYDGLGGMKEEASTYDIARITGTPAVLVVDASQGVGSQPFTSASDPGIPGVPGRKPDPGGDLQPDEPWHVSPDEEAGGRGDRS